MPRTGARMTAAGLNRRSEIVQAARDICMEKGFSHITVSDIASRVGMTRSLFYHYFPDKSSVAEAVLDDAIQQTINQLNDWNNNRKVGHIREAVDDLIALMRRIVRSNGPFREQMINGGNAELYLAFLDRAADKIAEFMCQTAVRDFERLHGRKITNAYEIMVMLIIGLVSLMRMNPDISTVQIRTIVAETLHIEDYVGE